MVTAGSLPKRAPVLSRLPLSLFVNGKVSVPLNQVYAVTCIDFETKVGEFEVRFWIYQKPDGKIATLFDACEICGPVGFYKVRTGLFAKNCAAPINPQSVGMPAGVIPSR